MIMKTKMLSFSYQTDYKASIFATIPAQEPGKTVLGKFYLFPLDVSRVVSAIYGGWFWYYTTKCRQIIYIIAF